MMKQGLYDYKPLQNLIKNVYVPTTYDFISQLSKSMTTSDPVDSICQIYDTNQKTFNILQMLYLSVIQPNESQHCCRSQLNLSRNYILLILIY